METNFKGTIGELEKKLRQSFIDETKNKLWAENLDNDCGFSEKYVFWLEQKILITDAFNIRQQINCDLPELLERYNKAVELVKKVLEENHCTPDLDREIEQFLKTLE